MGAVLGAAVSKALLLRELEQDWKEGSSAPVASADVLLGPSWGAELETGEDTRTLTLALGSSPFSSQSPLWCSCSLMPDLVKHLPWLGP